MQNTAERSQTLSSSKDRLAAIKEERLQKQATAHNTQSPAEVSTPKMSSINSTPKQTITLPSKQTTPSPTQPEEPAASSKKSLS